MPYFLLVLAFVIAVYIFLEKKKQGDLKRTGIKVPGVIIDNNEDGPNQRERLGGNINTPTVKFITVKGEEIIGKPIVGFISQEEVIVPYAVYVFYDRTNPKRFCLDN